MLSVVVVDNQQSLRRTDQQVGAYISPVCVFSMHFIEMILIPVKSNSCKNHRRKKGLRDRPLHFLMPLFIKDLFKVFFFLFAFSKERFILDIQFLARLDVTPELLCAKERSSFRRARR